MLAFPKRRREMFMSLRLHLSLVLVAAVAAVGSGCGGDKDTKPVVTVAPPTPTATVSVAQWMDLLTVQVGKMVKPITDIQKELEASRRTGMKPLWSMVCSRADELRDAAVLPAQPPPAALEVYAYRMGLWLERVRSDAAGIKDACKLENEVRLQQAFQRLQTTLKEEPPMPSQ
ncbi:hypothetical protein [Tepidiforma sp.]|uniref:hypothetical protein n=1 Tax=Tepidiforma sp. TaxID=2682230 RepID=UPI0026299E9A|nr:hypothetical protein [Tepidiforma sp.]MCX7617091.1 hypothetical protein [Tepidiforma sp.]